MLSFKEYLIEEDSITQKLDAIKQRIEDEGEEQVTNTGSKRDRKFNIDKQRYSKMARMARNQARNGPIYDEDDDGYGNSGLGNPEGMKTGGGSGFSG